MSVARRQMQMGLGRYSALLVVLLLLLFFSPLVTAFASVSGVSAVVIVAAIAITLRDRPRVAWTVTIAGVIALGTHAASSRPWLTFGAYVTLLFLASWTILVDVLQRPMRRSEAVAGGAAVYVLVGFLFGMVYALLLALDPGALAMPDDPTAQGATQAAFYFSFVALTTLGYGDITPASPMACSAATTEAVIGVLFISAIIARALTVQPDAAEAER